MLVHIQFTTNGSSTVLGNFGPGDRIRVKPDMARHLVEEARCAKYVERSPAPDDAPAVEPAPIEPEADSLPPKPQRPRRSSKQS